MKNINGKYYNNLLEYFLSDKEFKVASHPTKDLHCISYTHPGVDWSKPYMLSARGLIIDSLDNIIVRPYSKFFNYKQFDDNNPFNIPASWCEWKEEMEYDILEKIDGSMLAVSFNPYTEEYVAGLTFGIPNGPVAMKGLDMMLNSLNTGLSSLHHFEGETEEILKKILSKWTFVFEMVSKDHTIVIDYKEDALILHGIINNETGEIATLDVINRVCSFLFSDYYVRPIKSLSFNGDYKKFLDEVPNEKGIEGYVIRFADGFQLKIKTDEYLDIHRYATIFFGEVNTQSNNLLIIEMIEDNTIDDFVSRMRTMNRTEVVNHIDLVQKILLKAQSTKRTAELIAKAIPDRKDFFKSNIGDAFLRTLVALSYNNTEDKSDRQREAVKKYVLKFLKDLK